MSLLKLRSISTRLVLAIAITVAVACALLAVYTVTTANDSGTPIAGVEPGRDNISVLGVTPIVRNGKSVAAIDVGISLGKPFADHIKQRFGIDIAIHSFDGKVFGMLASSFGETG